MVTQIFRGDREHCIHIHALIHGPFLLHYYYYCEPSCNSVCRCAVIGLCWMLNYFFSLSPYLTDSTRRIIYRRLSHFLCCSVYLSGNEVSDSFTHSFGRVLAKAVSRWPLTAETGIGSQVSTSEICDRLALWQGFLRWLWFDPVSIIAVSVLCLSSSAWCSYQKDRRAKHGNLPNNNALS